MLQTVWAILHNKLDKMKNILISVLCITIFVAGCSGRAGKTVRADTGIRNTTSSTINNDSIPLARLCSLASNTTPWGSLLYLNSKTGDTLIASLERVILHEVLFRRFIVNFRSFRDTILFEDQTPQYVRASEKSIQSFLLFGKDTSHFNTGMTYNLEYDLKYISMLKSTIRCSDSEFYDYSLTDVGVFKGTKMRPMFMSRLFLDSNFNVLGAALSNIEGEFIIARQP